MLDLYVFRNSLKTLYARFDTAIVRVTRFVVVFTALLLMNMHVGFSGRFSGTFISILIAFICMALPYFASCWILAGYLILNISGASLELASLIGVLMLLVALSYYVFNPGDSVLLILVPIAFALRIPYVIPLVVGLSCGLMSIIPVSVGVVVYYICLYAKQNVGTLTNTDLEGVAQRYVQTINGIFSNRTMILYLVAFAAVLVIVYLIRNLSIDYAWQIAIAAGAVALLVVVFTGEILYGISLSAIQVVGGVFVSAMLAFIFNFFVFAVDYSRTEHTQFEDDDYYYYVKAVPKITVAPPDVKVQTFNIRRANGRENREVKNKKK